MDVIFDIETVPGQAAHVRDAIQAAIEVDKAEISAPGNYKDAAKINAYIQERRAELDAKAEERWLKTSFDGALGEIICISYQIEDNPIQNVWRDLGQSEADMLMEFFGDLRGRAHGQQRAPTVIGHNILGFDLRFLFHRCVILGVNPGMRIPHDARGNHDPNMYDTMIAWAGWGNRVKLDTVCKAIGVAGKTEGMDGSQVWPYVEAGRIQEVVAYCDDDVLATRRVYDRLTFREAA